MSAPTPPSPKRLAPTRWTSLGLGAATFALALAAGLGLGRDEERAPAAKSTRSQPEAQSVEPSPATSSALSGADARTPSIEDARWAALDPALLERARDPRKVPDIFVVLEAPPPKPPAPPPAPRVPKPPAPPPVVQAPPPPEIAAPPPAPSAPPLPFRYVGGLEEAERGPRAFLARQDQSFAVGVGDRIEGTYEIVAIERAQIVFKYLPLGLEQRLAR